MTTYMFERDLSLLSLPLRKAQWSLGCEVFRCSASFPAIDASFFSIGHQSEVPNSTPLVWKLEKESSGTSVRAVINMRRRPHADSHPRLSFNLSTKGTSQRVNYGISGQLSDITPFHEANRTSNVPGATCQCHAKFRPPVIESSGVSKHRIQLRAPFLRGYVS